MKATPLLLGACLCVFGLIRENNKIIHRKKRKNVHKRDLKAREKKAICHLFSIFKSDYVFSSHLVWLRSLSPSIYIQSVRRTKEAVLSIKY